MHVLIAAMGKLKSSPEQALYASYIKRLPWKITCKEFEPKPGKQQALKSQETVTLLNACQPCSRLIALDESGKTLSSREFAAQLAQWQQQGHSSYAFMIGGSDGLDSALLKPAHLVWSLGRVTWPHMLVRCLLAEQLYRSYSILNNHPYHRE